MKKKMRKVLVLILALVMMFTYAVPAMAATAGTLKYGVWQRPSSAKGTTSSGRYIPYVIKTPCKGTLTIYADSRDPEDGTLLWDSYNLYSDGAMKNCVISNTGGAKGNAVIKKFLNKGTYYFVCSAFSSKVKLAFTPSKRTISSLTNNSSKAMTVKWDKLDGATGYQIQYSSSSSFSTKKTLSVTDASIISKKISSLTKGKTYYVRVRAYSTLDGKNYYSSWSDVKKVKITL